jgi:dihydrofolate synthase / folylpolyglutamate synthase
MQFDEALKYLLSLGHETLAMKLGLRNTETLLAALGNPQQSFQSIQIAGTNGKGSTAVMIDSILRAAGIRSGLYTSPHLVSVTERIRIGESEISRDEFARLATMVRQTAEQLVVEERLPALPTFFEQVTAIALLAFRDAKIDLAVLETGLGGRLDATTCAGATVVVITSIAMDHENYLGNSIQEIAAEKAAIIRPGVVAIVAPQTDAVRNVVAEYAAMNKVVPMFDETESTVAEVSSDGRFNVSFKTRKTSYERVWLGLRGRHQIENASLAIGVAEALDISEVAIVKGIETANHPGRLELIPGNPRVLLDGAHNPAGAAMLRDYLVEFALVEFAPRPLTLVFGAMTDKKLREMAQALFPIADRLVLTEVANPRTARLETLEELALEFLEAERVSATKNAHDAMRIAREVTPADGLICIAGSLYLIGEINHDH